MTYFKNGKSTTKKKVKKTAQELLESFGAGMISNKVKEKKIDNFEQEEDGDDFGDEEEEEQYYEEGEEEEEDYEFSEGKDDNGEEKRR